MKKSILLLGFCTTVLSVNAQKTIRTAGQNCGISEFVNIHDDLTQNYPHWLRKESDHFDDKVVTIATTQDNSGDIYVSLSNISGDVIWTKQFGGDNIDRGTSIKKCENGFIVAGTTRSFDGSTILKPFLMKLDNAGDLVWFKTYNFDEHILNVNVVELNDKNFALAGFYNPWEYAGQKHEFFTMTTDSSGTLLDLKERGKTSRDWEVIRDVTATADGGFVVVGCDGHDDDYHSGIIMKFDNTNGMQWATELRRNLPGGTYDLTGPASERSNTYFNAVKEKPNGEFVVVGRTSDHDGAASNATFRSGIISVFSPTGGHLNTRVFSHDQNSILVFHNVVINSNEEYIVVGQTINDISGDQYPIMLGVDNSLALSGINTPKYYDFSPRSAALAVWEEDFNAGYSITGLTGATGTTKQAFVLKTDIHGNGSDICFGDFTVITEDPDVRAIDYEPSDLSPLYTELSFIPDQEDYCVPMLNCEDAPSSMAPAGEEYLPGNADEWLDVSPAGNDGANSLTNGVKHDNVPLNFYPNPTKEILQFDRAVEMIEILDLSGRSVLKVTGEITQLNIESLAVGAYMLVYKEYGVDAMHSAQFIKE